MFIATQLKIIKTHPPPGEWRLVMLHSLEFYIALKRNGLRLCLNLRKNDQSLKKKKKRSQGEEESHGEILFK